jgi:plasmid maintenance system antidote protein VapI
MSENQTLPKNGMLPVHPGEFLKEEFTDELEAQLLSLQKHCKFITRV